MTQSITDSPQHTKCDPRVVNATKNIQSSRYTLDGTEYSKFTVCHDMTTTNGLLFIMEYPSSYITHVAKVPNEIQIPSDENIRHVEWDFKGNDIKCIRVFEQITQDNIIDRKIVGLQFIDMKDNVYSCGKINPSNDDIYKYNGYILKPSAAVTSKPVLHSTIWTFDKRGDLYQIQATWTKSFTLMSRQEDEIKTRESRRHDLSTIEQQPTQLVRLESPPETEIAFAIPKRGFPKKSLHASFPANHPVVNTPPKPMRTIGRFLDHKEVRYTAYILCFACWMYVAKQLYNRYTNVVVPNSPIMPQRLYDSEKSSHQQQRKWREQQQRWTWNPRRHS